MEFGSFQMCTIPDAYFIVRAVLCSIIAVPAIFGNVLILVGVCKMKKTGGRAYFILIANLAVTDLFLGFWILLFPLEKIFPQLSEMRYFCMARISMIATLSACTAATIGFIATRRFICVKFPIQERRYRPILDKILYGFIVLLWIAAVIVGYIPVMVLHIYDKGHEVRCDNGYIYPIELTFFTAICVLVFLVYNTVLYIWMMYILVRKAEFKDKNHQTNYARTAVMALVFLIFAVCWLPHVVMCVISFWDQGEYCKIEYAAIPGYLNAALNWIVYGATNSQVMQTVRATKLFSCMKNKNKQENSGRITTSKDTSKRRQYRDDTSTSC